MAGSASQLAIIIMVLLLSACDSQDSKPLTSTISAKTGAVCLSPRPMTHRADPLPAGCVEIEGRFTGRIRVTVSDGDPQADGQVTYLMVDDDGSRVTLRFNNGTPRVQSGDRVSVTGLRRTCPGVPDLIVSSASPTPLESAMSSSLFPFANTLGAQKTAAILVSFQDKANPFTLSQVQDVVFNQVSSYWYDTSYGQTTVSGQAYGPYTVALPSGVCDVDKMAELANAAAAQVGVDVTQFSHLLYVFPYTISCGGWIGLGTIGGLPSEAWINGALDLHTVAHEMGHNLGLYHSKALNCGSNESVGENCSGIEYGDLTDVMGNGYPGQYTAYQKEQLGWLNYGNSPPVQTVSTDGTYSISPLESMDASPKALRVLRSQNPYSGYSDYYYIEYRQPTGADGVLGNLGFPNNITAGVMLHLGSDTNMDSSYLINVNPSMGSWYEAALNVGQTYTDAAAQVSITLQSVTASGAVLAVSIGDGKGAQVNCN